MPTTCPFRTLFCQQLLLIFGETDILSRSCLVTVAVLRGDSKITGTVTFEQTSESGPTTITWDITGHDANAERGMHVHQFGDNTNGCTSAGPHCMYLPTKGPSSRRTTDKNKCLLSTQTTHSARPTVPPQTLTVTSVTLETSRPMVKVTPRVA